MDTCPFMVSQLKCIANIYFLSQIDYILNSMCFTFKFRQDLWGLIAAVSTLGQISQFIIAITAITDRANTLPQKVADC